VPSSGELEARILYSGEITMNLLLKAKIALSKQSFCVSLSIYGSISAPLKLNGLVSDGLKNYQDGTDKLPS
jgi:hypothetical protein